jgi:glutamyl-tRNA synthetase
MTVRTRFAPSPTGYLHIGGVRTAFYNWLFARRHGGRFVLRIDDTDQQRNVAEALQPILDGFRWLGIDWDEGPEAGGDYGPYYQSQRLARYQAAVAELVRRGFAYHDFATPEELQREREAAQAEKRNLLYSRRWAAASEEDRRRFEAQGRRGVVRLKMPREGSCRFEDLVRGDVEVQWIQEQDHVVQRADGTCLYHLASVVDDHDMAITHVIRAEEHLSNTPRQLFIADGLGHEPPRFAHLPVVAEPGSKNKLSKRKLEKYLRNPDFAKLDEHGRRIAERIGLKTSAEAFNPVVIDFYARVGFLPHAILNYLLLLGWSLDDRTEFLSREEMIEQFSLERVNKSAASFDPKKLLAFQEHYMWPLPPARKVGLVRPFVEQAGLLRHIEPATVERMLSRIVEAAGDRIKVAGDILDYSEFFVPDDQLPFDEEAFEKRIRRRPAVGGILARFGERLATVEPFDAPTLEASFRGFVDSEGIDAAEAVHALRVAVTGKAIGFGLFDALEILGRRRCKSRIDKALARL